MTSVEGVDFLAILRKNGTTVDRQMVSLSWADAQLANIPPGEYTDVAFYKSINSP